MSVSTLSRGSEGADLPVVVKGGGETSELSNSKPSRSTKGTKDLYLKCWKVHYYVYFAPD